MAGTKLYCLVTEAHRCEQLAKVVTQLCPEKDLNPRPVDRKSNALPVAPALVTHFIKNVKVIICHLPGTLLCTGRCVSCPLSRSMYLHYSQWLKWKSRGGGTVIYSLGPLSAVAGP